MRTPLARQRRPLVQQPAGRIGALAIGTLALGAFAIGALAIGALAVGRLAVGRLSVRRLEAGDFSAKRARIDHLSIGTLDVERVERLGKDR